MHRKLIVDPPRGWKYGFPKPIPENILHIDGAFKLWLLKEGYPSEEIEFALKYSRYWEAEVEENIDD